MDDLSMPSARARPREPVCKSTSWRAFRVPLGRGSEQPRSAPSPRSSQSDPRSSSRPGDPDAAPICPSRRQEPVLKSPSARATLQEPSPGEQRLFVETCSWRPQRCIFQVFRSIESQKVYNSLHIFKFSRSGDPKSL